MVHESGESSSAAEPTGVNNQGSDREQQERAEFEAALAAADDRPRFEAGQLVSGVVAGIQDDAILVSFGGKSEVVLPKGEDDGDLQTGDPIEAVVVAVAPELKLSRGLAAERRSAVELRSAYESGVPVEGKVLARNKGGFHVSIGRVPAFCPVSQIDLGHVKDPANYLERSFPFRIIEYAEGGRRIVVSRAVILREEREKKASEARTKVLPGAELRGKITSLTDYGAFVDLGGVEGMVHVSEISRRRVHNPKEVVKVGDEVTVKVLKVEQEGKRISLSMKELEADPFADFATRVAPGTAFTGTILRATDFGFFVEVEPGVEGLVHVSQLPPGVGRNDPSLAPGQTVTGWIRDIDPERRRISLALREVAVGDPWDDVLRNFPTGSVVEGKVERFAPFGIFVNVAPGLTGLVPLSETGLSHGSDPSRAFAAGQSIAVKVLSVDTERKRISLSVEGAREEAARGEFREYADRANSVASSAGLNAMAAAFAKLKKD